MTQQSLVRRAWWQSIHPLDRPIARPIPGAWLAMALLFSGLTVAVMMAHAGMKIPVANLGCALVSASIAALAGIRYAARSPSTRHQVRLRDFSESVLLFMSISLLGVIASYPAAAATSGFVDPALANMDRLLHFNWIAWYLTVADHPYLRYVSATAYASIFVSPVVLLGYFSWTHRRFEARKFLATFWLAAVLTLVLFFRFPAEGPLAFLWHGPIPYMPTSALYQEQLIPELRAHQLTTINLGALRGLVCAPSFHTVSGVLYMAAAWPIARLRWPLVALNTAMLLATPIEGTHYLTDMLAGLIVAIIATAVVAVALRIHTQRHAR
jgi:hypothetical protein